MPSAARQWDIVLETDPNADLRAGIVAPLAAYNDRAAGPAHHDLLAITLRDQEGAISGGLWGRIGYGFLFIELLTTGEAAGQGFGRRIMQAAEEEARSRRLHGIWLDTWTFQAPGFYEKLGFLEVGRISDYPPGHDRIFFCKRLP